MMGMFGKIVVFRAAVHGAAVWLAVVMAVNTVIGLYYYLTWVVRLFGPGKARPVRVGRAAGVAIQVGSAPSPLPELPAAVEVAAYRIAVEAMTNAVRHAGARACRVQLDAADQLTIEVTDDGRGLGEPPRAGTGLESMRERAAEVGGELSVERRPEGGTRVIARLPLGTGAAT